MTRFGIRARLREGLRSVRGGRVGEHYDASRDRAFARLDDASEGAFQLVLSAMVGTWEVSIADVGRALEGRGVDAHVRKGLCDRMSDALVPLQAPFQALPRAFRTALRTAVRHALTTRRLDDATRPLVDVLRTLRDAAVLGFDKMLAYLDPFDPFLPAGYRAEMGQEARALTALLDSETDAMAAKLRHVADQGDLEAGLLDALDGWRSGMSAGLETFLYARRTDLVRGIEARR